MKHEFRLGLKIFCRPLGVIGCGGLGCVTYHVPQVSSFDNKRHPCGPCKVVGACEFVKIIASRSGWGERSSTLCC